MGNTLDIRKDLIQNINNLFLLNIDIYMVGDKRTKKDMLKNIKCEIFNEYPKVEEIKYDINNPQPVDERLNKPLTKNHEIIEDYEDDEDKLFDF